MTIKSIMKNTRRAEEEVDAIVDDILDEDEENDATQLGSCPGDCEDPNNIPKETARQCKCGVENSSRFSLRVMEAMRLLQRDVNQPSTSSAEDIVDYIRMNYRNDGDLYAQVRTALRQVCSQGFVMEILNNEYHLIGPVVRPIRRNGCSLDCKGRVITAINDTSRRRKIVNNHEELSPVCDCKDTSDIRNDRRQRDITGRREIEGRDEDAEPIPGPSRGFVRVPSPIPARNAKKARIEDQKVQRTDEDDEETTTEEDMDADVEITRDEYSRRGPLDRTRDIRNQQNGDRREIAEEDEEDEGDGRVEEEDEEDRELPRQPRRRNRTRERELRDWIRRCREECERQRMQ